MAARRPDATTRPTRAKPDFGQPSALRFAPSPSIPSITSIPSISPELRLIARGLIACNRLGTARASQLPALSFNFQLQLANLSRREAQDLSQEQRTDTRDVPPVHAVHLVPM
jgi:hypothetical protein